MRRLVIYALCIVVLLGALLLVGQFAVTGIMRLSGQYELQMAQADADRAEAEARAAQAQEGVYEARAKVVLNEAIGAAIQAPAEAAARAVDRQGFTSMLRDVVLIALAVIYAEDRIRRRKNA